MWKRVIFTLALHFLSLLHAFIKNMKFLCTADFTLKQFQVLKIFILQNLFMKCIYWVFLLVSLSWISALKALHKEETGGVKKDKSLSHLTALNSTYQKCINSNIAPSLQKMLHVGHFVRLEFVCDRVTYRFKQDES